MMSVVAAVFLVAINSILVSNVYSQSNDCGYLSRKDSEEGNFPWVVYIIRKGFFGTSSCDGFLIDRRHLLTAARCTPQKRMLDRYTVHVGKKNGNESEEYKITCIITHPRFDPSQVYDNIAILTMSRDVDIPNFTPICLPDDDLRTQRLDGLTLATWLANRSKKYTLMQYTGMHMMSYKDCNNMLFEYHGWRMYFPGAISGDMLCTIYPTHDDDLDPWGHLFGAPLMYKDNRNKWIAIGISISKGSSITSRSPRAYIKISDYVEWIVENTTNGKGECS